MTLILVDQITARLTYTLDFVFTARGLSYKATTNITEFIEFKGTKLNYSNKEIDLTPSIIPSELLYSEIVERISLDKVEFERTEILAFNETPDILASIFFVLSRYEEYLNITRDEHGRFLALCSIQWVYGWLDEPICDKWALCVLKFIGNTEMPTPEFIIQPTFDIDSTFAYKEKGLIRNIAGGIKELMHGKTQRFLERFNVCFRRTNDPFDTFERINEVAQQFPDTLCFWLLADYGNFNKNIHHANAAQAGIINSMAERCKIAIHPGYNTFNNEANLEVEKNRLENIVERSVNLSRQHYLRLSIPITFNALIKQNINVDYSMGYAECPGFRMGTARQTPWFNLETNESTSLQIQPFCYMDGTLNERLKLTPENAIEEVRQLKAMIKQYGGTFSFIWHNETIGFRHHWEGWESVFEESLRP